MRISGNIVDIQTGGIYAGTLTISDGRIKEIKKDNTRYDTYIIPPFIDAHVHIESSMLTPTEFARLAVVHGTGACVSDPHEIANVMGAAGVRYMLDNAEKTPFHFYFGAPSCVPATPFETAGGEISVACVRELFTDSRIKYLSEMMNIPGVLNRDADVMAKMDAALSTGRRVDGHAPVLRGKVLHEYVKTGITADHEVITYAEGAEKISLGMKVQIREGSAAKNFEELADLLHDHPDMCMLCSDDLHPDALVRGHINLLVKRAVGRGVDVIKVLRAACLTPVEHYGLDCGVLREGDSADLLVVDSLSGLNVLQVYIRGELCAENGKALLQNVKEEHINNFHVHEKAPADFGYPERRQIDVITVTNGQLVTGRETADPKVAGGECVADTDRDILKISVINRYRDEKPTVAFVKNFGIRLGAIASSVAHDSHNIVCVGADDESMAAAVNLIIGSRGGLSAVCGDQRAVVPLPVAGLMTDADGYETAHSYEQVAKLARSMGSMLSDPMMTLSFMALLVIPALKISDKGLFDGEKFAFID